MKPGTQIHCLEAPHWAANIPVKFVGTTGKKEPSLYTTVQVNVYMHITGGNKERASAVVACQKSA